MAHQFGAGSGVPGRGPAGNIYEDEEDEEFYYEDEEDSYSADKVKHQYIQQSQQKQAEHDNKMMSAQSRNQPSTSSASFINNQASYMKNSDEITNRTTHGETIHVKLSEGYFSNERKKVVNLLANLRSKFNSMQMFDPAKNKSINEQQQSWKEDVSK